MYIHIQAPKSKSSIRTVPIPSSLINILKEHDKMQTLEKEKANDSYIDTKFVFTTETGKPIEARTLQEVMKEY